MVHVSADVCGGQNWIPLELELEASVSHQMWVLGSVLGILEEQYVFFPSFQS